MLVPLGDDNTGRRSRPVITPLLIALNTLVFLYQVSLGSLSGEGQQRFILAWSATPYELTHLTDVAGPVRLDGSAVTGPEDLGEPSPEIVFHVDNPALAGPLMLLTVFSAMFMHGGWAHFLGNMLFLWIFGDNVEDETGPRRFVWFYLLTGIAATAAQVLVQPNSLVPMLGASGAISGVMGAYLVLHPKRRVRLLLLYRVISVPALIFVGGWALLQFVNGFGAMAPSAETSGVAYMAHIGGFVAGLVLILPFRRRLALAERSGRRR